MVKGSNSVRNKALRSSKPYDASNSFVRQVTSRVSSLLPQTTWLSRWLGPQDGETERKDEAQVNDQESDDEDDVEHQPPPAKRPRIPLNKPFPSNSFTISPTISPIVNNRVSTSLIEEPLGGGSCSSRSRNDLNTDGAVAGPSGLNTRQRVVSSTPNFQSPARPQLLLAERKVNGDDQSESSESTSGCSSLVPQANRQFQASETVLNSLSARRRSIDEKLNFTGHLQSPRSLFSDRSHSQNPQLNFSRTRRRPSFNVASFTSPLLEADKDAAKSKIINSPFYAGRTTFGGASAYRRMKDGLFSPNESFTKRCGVQVKPVVSDKDSSDLSCMSATARRILEALEQFSSPVRDAKQIPMVESTPVLAKRKRLLDGGMNLLPSKPMKVREGNSPATRELTIPTVSDLLKMKHREKLQDSLESARLIAASSSHLNSSMSDVNSEYKLRFEDREKQAKHTGKIKSKEKDLEMEPPEEVKLPNISLPITTLPKFDFVVPAAASTSSSPSTTCTFKFSAPIIVTDSIRTCVTVDNFTFSKPLSASKIAKDTKQSSKNNSDSSETVQVNCLNPFTKPLVGNQLQFKSGDHPSPPSKRALPKNNGQASDVAFGVKPAAELKSGSVMDILKKKSVASAKEENKKDIKDANSIKSDPWEKFKKSVEGMWECNSCLIRNNSDVVNCVACTAPRTPATSSQATPVSSAVTSTVATSFGSQFKMSADQWECQSCMVRNKVSDKTCVSCTAAKPGEEKQQPNKKSSVVNSFAGFGNKFKPPLETWECGTCMVRNSNSRDSCEACNAKRPGKAAADVSTKNETFSGFGDKFKKPQGSWECPDCMVRNKPEASKCIACERAKPGTESESKSTSVKSTSSATTKFNFSIPAEASNFKFGIDKVSEKDKQALQTSGGFSFGEVKAKESTGFSFGIPTTTTTTTTTTAAADKSDSKAAGPTFTFGTATTSSASTEKAHPFTLPTSTAAKIPAFSFGSSQNSKTHAENSDKKKETSKSESQVLTSNTLSDSSSSKKQVSFTDNAAKAKEATKETTVQDSPFGTKFSSVSSVEKPASETKTSEPIQPASVPSSSASTANTSAVTVSFTTANTVTTTASTPSFSFMPTGSSTKPTGLGFGSTLGSPFSSTAVTTASTLFSFGTSKPSLGFGNTNNADNSFGQSLSNTASPFSLQPKTTTPTFSFGAKAKRPVEDTTSEKPFGGTEDDKSSAKKLATPFAITTTTPSLFGATTATTTASSAVVPGVEATAVPSLGGSALAPTFGQQSNSAISFAAPSTTTAVSMNTTTTTAVSGFGTTSAPAFSSGFPQLGEQKQSTLSTMEKPSNTGMFSFGTACPVNNAGQASSGFSFGNVQNTATPKSAAFTFGDASNSAAPSGLTGNTGFSFTANTTPNFSFGSGAVNSAPNTVAPTLFGSPAASSVTVPAFGATPAPETTPAANPVAPFGSSTPGGFNFSFGANNMQAQQQQPTPPVFGFGASQPSATSSLQFASPSPAFPFGQSQAASQPSGSAVAPSPVPPAAPTFNPNVRPSFNFSKGETPTFTASPAPGATAPPQRRIKKAIRRTLLR